MHLILTGATGLVGSGVLDAMIKTKAITKISIVSRRPVKMVEDLNDSRINVVINKNFENYDADVLQQLQGASGCVWALGISQMQVGPEEYVKITKDYALTAAKAFAALPGVAGNRAGGGEEPFRFVYVSGEGATQNPGRFTPIFGRIKGETESALADLTSSVVAGHPRLAADSVRPAFVDASDHAAIRPFIPARSALLRVGDVVLGPAIRTLYKQGVSPTEPLGHFLTGMAMGRYDESQLAGNGVFKIGQSNVVENVGIRRIMGL